jgi:serine/threonine protein kinase
MTVCFFCFSFLQHHSLTARTLLQDRHLKVLGGGAEAQVLLMEHKEKNIKCAVKRLLKPTRREIAMGQKTWNTDWKKDVEKIAQLKSPFIVRMYDAFEDNDYAYIVMEYCEIGDLSYLTHQRRTAGQQFTEGVSHSRSLVFPMLMSFVSYSLLLFWYCGFV